MHMNDRITFTSECCRLLIVLVYISICIHDDKYECEIDGYELDRKMSDWDRLAAWLSIQVRKGFIAWASLIQPRV